ncbi:MAG TPA: heavy metal-binding domain-containing protein [bacterium]|nr:heavy metal-binding domain-containing protein [bacterium]
MKKILALFSITAFLVLGAGNLWAHDDDKTPDQSLTGEVVCLSCYLSHGGQGDIHAKCAKQCFTKGLPVGLLVGNQLYLLVGEKHGTVNKMMNAYAGKQVTVSGHVFQQEGMNMMEVESVKAGTSTASSSKTVQSTWVCPMGDYSGPKTASGKCPKCGMDLVQKK